MSQLFLRNLFPWGFALPYAALFLGLLPAQSLELARTPVVVSLVAAVGWLVGSTIHRASRQSGRWGLIGLAVLSGIAAWLFLEQGELGAP